MMVPRSLPEGAPDILDVCPDKILPEPNSGCWLWAAGVDTGGYGCVSWFGRQRTAHKASAFCSSRTSRVS